MFAANNQDNININNCSPNAKWQLDKFVFHYGDKQSLCDSGVGLQTSVLLSPTTPTTTTAGLNKCCIPSPFQVPTDDVFFGSTTKTATYISSACSVNSTPQEDFFLLDTPKSSAFCPESVSTAMPQPDCVFKFEPEHIELMNKCDQYIDANFNDDNCQAKHFSPCHTPPNDEYTNYDYSNYRTPLPPITTIHQSTAQYHHHYDEHFIDTSFLAQYPSPVPRFHQTTIESNSFQLDDSYAQPANLNVTGDDKPNREFKTIEFDDLVREVAAPTNLISAMIHEGEEEEDEDTLGEKSAADGDSLEPVTCLWTDCYKDFSSQSDLVAHIEKLHIEGRKGEEFSCFWKGCSRATKPFNARYKLLIHMRVHSGEKPNKCPFSGCDKSFSRLENLKIHQRSHTGERPYHCQFKGCTKAFSNSSDRAKHQRTHYDTKPYACQLQGCTKRYTDPSSLRKHVKNHGARQKATHSRRRSHKEAGTTTTGSVRGKKRCHSESSIKSNVSVYSQLELTIPETIGSADEDDNNYFDMYNGTFEDDEVFVNRPATNTDSLQLQDNHQNIATTIQMNELSSCLDKIQNSEAVYEEVDYSNLFATVDVANEVDIDKLIHSNDYEQNEFVPFEYVKKLMYDESSNNHNSYNQMNNLEQFSYGML